MTKHAVLLVVALTALAAAACAAPAQQTAVAEPEPAPFDPIGVYDFTTQIEGNAVAGVLTVRRNADGGLSATVTSPATGGIPMNSVTQNGNTLEMAANLQGESLRMTITLGENGTLSGGWVLSSGASGGVTGTRRAGSADPGRGPAG